MCWDSKLVIKSFLNLFLLNLFVFSLISYLLIIFPCFIFFTLHLHTRAMRQEGDVTNEEVIFRKFKHTHKMRNIYICKSISLCGSEIFRYFLLLYILDLFNWRQKKTSRIFIVEFSNQEFSSFDSGVPLSMVYVHEVWIEEFVKCQKSSLVIRVKNFNFNHKQHGYEKFFSNWMKIFV